AAPPVPVPVLTLSHFSRPPFLSFDGVRPGASRSAALALDNPNDEAADVQVDRFPAPHQGFALAPRRFLLQPRERILITITWTPLEEGRVRELITFLVNGIVRHQAVLLGNAEKPKKKKRSLWDTIKKKKNVKEAVSSRTTRRCPNAKNVNKTFTVSQKANKVRSPLQACENLVVIEGNTSPDDNSLILEENKFPLSPISPVMKECHGLTCTPLSMRRSTTYSLRTSNKGLSQEENSGIWADFHLNEEVTTASRHHSGADSVLVKTASVKVEIGSRKSPIIFSPDNLSALPMTQNQGAFLSPDSFVSNSYGIKKDLAMEPTAPLLTPDRLIKDDVKPTSLEPPGPELQKTYIQRVILSPDSFVNNSYSFNEGPESDPVRPILSPSQFLKDNMTALQPALEQAHKLSQTYLLDMDSQISKPSVWMKNEVVPPRIEGGTEVSNHGPGEADSRDARLTSYSPAKRNHLKVPEIRSPSGGQLKRRPILSATVVKSKSDSARGKQTGSGKPKSRRCLRSEVADCDNTLVNPAKSEKFDNLPIIGPVSAGADGSEDAATISGSSRKTLVSCKRKSEEHSSDISVRVSVNEYVEMRETKRIHISQVETKKTAVLRKPVSKHSSSRDKPNHKKKTDLLRSRSSSSTINRKMKPVAVAQSHLTFIKPLKTVIPRHPMPFAAKNMFYDERWMEKQEKGFLWWLNFILTPDDLTVKTNTSQVNAATLLLGLENHHKVCVPKAPTKDEMSLRAYTARCRLNRLRRAACRLFTSELMVKAIKKLEVEIEARRLLVRKDRHLWKDIGERQKVLNWLLSYNPLWLRIGLETVFGELISLEDNSDVAGLAVFILNRLLWNPDIAADFRHPTVPHLYRDGHEEALSKFTLKKLLLLVCFLDRAKLTRLIDHDPCLFCKDAAFKSSKEILLAFSRDFLSGEGDLSRHLGFLGLPVSHTQTPLDEFEFAVTNLAVDLQCGVRLVRTMELLTQNWDLSKKLRIPAISRLQKMHNVDIVLQVLKERGVQLNDERGTAIQCKDIVDRHRERTLALLWKIAFTFQVEISLNVKEITEEIEFLKRAWNMKKKMAALSSHIDVPDNIKRHSRSSFSAEQYSENVKLLMTWVNAVCAFYGIKVENFTVSFSDGRVLCHLIHQYHPCYVPLEAICQRTTQTVECTQSGSVALNSSTDTDSSLEMWPGSFEQETTSELFKELLDNEKKNFQLVNTAVRNLGGIPAMIHHSDMSNTIPDEKVVITYLSFLCARLLELRKETRAARLIQAAWRKYQLRVYQKLYQEKEKAAVTIQRAVINFLTRQRIKKQITAAVVIQKHWRRYLAQRKSNMLRKAKLEKIQREAATIIQAYWRRYSSRRGFLKLKHYTTILQAKTRMIIALAAFKRQLWAIVTIQRHWRANLRRNEDQQKYRKLKSSSLVIQSAYRKWKRHKMERQTKATIVLQRAFREWRSREQARREKAAIVIQSWYRMQKDLRNYNHVKLCIILIQSRFRCIQAKRSYEAKRRCILTIQRYYRTYRKGKIARANYLQKRRAVIHLQAAFRGMIARRLYRRIKAALVLQSFWRMRQDRLKFLHVKKCVIILQSQIRKHKQLQNYKRMKRAACTIQTRFRAWIAGRNALSSYRRVRSAAVVLQSAYRRMQARKRVHLIRSAVKIQSVYRAYISRKGFLNLKEATIKMQALIKMKQAHRRYCALREATLYVQRRYRSNKIAVHCREEYERLREACIKVQAFVRGSLVRRQLELQRKAVILLQSYFRMRKERQNYLRIYRATVFIQNYYRAYRKQIYQRKTFMQVKKAVICLQAAYKGFKVRQVLKNKREAALKIQTAFRGHIKRRKYQAMLKSSVKIQRWYRACTTRRDVRTNFLRTREAVLVLQAVYRGWKVRRQIRRERDAAIRIQSVFRRFRAQRQFRLTKNAAVTIQRHFRARTVGRQWHREYIQLRRAASRLQAVWKGRAVRNHIQRQNQAALIIQSYYRMHVCRKRLKTVREATLLIQAYYRAYVTGKRQYDQYLKTKVATLVLQSAYRGSRVRKQVKELKKAAVTIQANYKSYKMKTKYATLRASAVSIQRWYRANRLRQDYLRLKSSVVKVQAVYRGLKVRRRVQRMHEAATRIQSVFKMHRLKIRYQAMRMAALVIQVRYRAFRQGKRQRDEYRNLRRSAVILQAAFRGARVRQKLRTMRAAATVIQSHYRKYKQRTYFLKLCLFTKRIQQRYRAGKERDIQVHRYSVLKRSTVHLQAAFRGMRTRRHLKAMHSAATLIQVRFRAFVVRKSYLSLRRAAILVQRKYRAAAVAKSHLRDYLCIRKAVITIQASYRGFVVRKRLQKAQRAATLIQATFRMHRSYIPYQAMKLASVIIQQRYRACREGRFQRAVYLKQRNSAVVIQSAYRGMRARQALEERHRAAVKIQSSYRRYRQYRLFRKVRWATEVIQKRYRANREREKAVERYCAMKKAAVCIQAAFRGLKIRKLCRKQRLAAVLIQRHFRCFMVRKRYLSLKTAAVVCQRRYRAMITAKKLTRAVICIQSTYRGFQVRKAVQQKHQAATIIQSAFRMYKVRIAYRAMRWAAFVLQNYYRSKARVKIERSKFLALRKATLTLQAAYRGMKVRQELRSVSERKAAAIVIQAAYRRYQTRTRFQAVRRAALIIQRWYKACRVTHIHRAAFCVQRRAAVTIQSAFRKMLARRIEKRKRAAQRIQVFFKMVVCRRKFLRLRTAAIVIQKCFRMWRERKWYETRRKAALALQHHYRAHLAVKQQRKVYLQTRNHVVTVQAEVRKFLHQRRFQKIKVSTVKIQALWRGFKARQLFCQMRAARKIQAWFRCCRAHKEYQAMRRAVHVIQGCVRTRLQRAWFLKMRASTVVIQRRWRAKVSARITYERFLITKMSAIKIQSVYRGYCIRKVMIKKHQAAALIQASYRGYIMRRNFLQQKAAAVIIQKHIQARKAGRRERAKYIKMKEAAVVLQAVSRGWLVRKRIVEQKRQRRLLHFTAAAYHHLSALKIQRAYRIHRALRQAQTQISSVIFIQRWFRARLQRKRFIQDRQKIIKVQNAVRTWLSRRNRAATVLQRAARRFLFSKREEKLKNRVVKIQALWRGYFWRKNNDSTKIRALRQRLKKVNEESREENKLYKRTALAIDYLLKYKHLSYILEALKHLEVATRLSPLCCENMAQSGTISKIFILILSCNRSVPCMEVIRYALQVLLNVAKYEKTTDAVYEVENCIDTLLELLQMYREKAGDKVADKGGSIFTKTCCLLALLLKVSKRAAEVRSRPKVVDRIHSLYKLTAHKHKMDAKRTLSKQKMNSSTNGSFFIPVTPIRTKVVSRLKPDWVLRKDNTREIVNPLQAILMVMDTLGIAHY
ncbi:abnormal spindle-like microcephaly-associated protein, partial [Ornithorhynchus anatinus]